MNATEDALIADARSRQQTKTPTKTSEISEQICRVTR